MSEPEQDLSPLLARILRQFAREGSTVTYRELAALAGLEGRYTIHRTAQALEAMMRADHAAGHPLLAALVVSRDASGLPRRGFFELLVELGRYDGPAEGPEARAVHEEELMLALDYWGGG